MARAGGKAEEYCHQAVSERRYTEETKFYKGAPEIRVVSQEEKLVDVKLRGKIIRVLVLQQKVEN